VRQRIAQALHDNLQQQLYAAEMQIQFLREDPTKTEAVDELEQMIIQALELTRGMTVKLSPPVLRGEGLVEAVTWLASHMQEIYGLRVTVHVTDHPHVDNEELNTLLLRMMRELLFNVVKHADVEEAEVCLEEDETGVTITISDHGLGFDVVHELTNKRNGFGLQSIKERLELFNGQINIETSPGQGTSVKLFLPHTQRTERSETQR
jgi:signal transduction histidine kinase